MVCYHIRRAARVWVDHPLGLASGANIATAILWKALRLPTVMKPHQHPGCDVRGLRPRTPAIPPLQHDEEHVVLPLREYDLEKGELYMSKNLRSRMFRMLSCPLDLRLGAVIYNGLLRFFLAHGRRRCN